MDIIRSAWVLRHEIVMGLHPLSSRLSCCDQFDVGPTHATCGTLDLLMTDVPEVVWVEVLAHRLVRSFISVGGQYGLGCYKLVR